MIRTNSKGQPLERPIPPDRSADIETKIQYLRDSSAYNDRVANLANQAFTKRFVKAMKRK